MIRFPWSRACGAVCFWSVAVLLAAAQTPLPPSDLGPSVWDGVYTAAQADRGRGFYLTSCAQCHGETLQGAESSSLRGDRFWAAWQDRTVGDLLGQISKNMPFSEDGSLAGTLGAATYADIVAHILRTNEFPAGDRDLTPATGAGVQIMRREGPGELPDGSYAHVTGCLARGDGKEWQLVQATAPARVTTGTDDEVMAPLGSREYTLRFVITPLEKFVGHRMSVRGALMGEGGADGINVGTIRSVSERCE